MKPAVRLIAVDLDGTLLTSAHQPAPGGMAALRRAAQMGVQVVIATTRNPSFVAPLYRQLGVTGPLICTNGAQVWASPDGPVWACHTIPLAAARRAAALADARGWELSITVGEITAQCRRSGEAPGPVSAHRRITRTNLEAVSGEPVRILAVEPAARAELRAVCAAEFAGSVRVEGYTTPLGVEESIGIFARQAEKGAALRLVLERLEIEPGAAAAVGDNFVDLAMFDCVATRVAMGNAPDPVKARATHIAPSNDAEGVAWAVQALL